MKGWVISWTQDWSHQQAIKRVIEIEQSSNRAIVWSSERAIERVIERSNSRASDRVTEGQRSPKRSIDRSIDRASERSGWLPLSGCRALRFTCNKQFVQMGASVLGHKHQIIEHPNLVCWLTQYCIVRSTNRSSTIKIKKSQILRCKNKIPRHQTHFSQVYKSRFRPSEYACWVTLYAFSYEHVFAAFRCEHQNKAFDYHNYELGFQNLVSDSKHYAFGCPKVESRNK